MSDRGSGRARRRVNRGRSQQKQHQRQAGWERRILAIWVVSLIVLVSGNLPTKQEEQHRIETTIAAPPDGSVEGSMRRPAATSEQPRETGRRRTTSGSSKGRRKKHGGINSMNGDNRSAEHIVLSPVAPRRRRRASNENVAVVIAQANNSSGGTAAGEDDLPDVGECILLYGAYCNGNMGDVIQPLALEHLLASIAPDQCFWYAHPGVETPSYGHHLGDFFGDDESRLIHLQAEDAGKVNRFKALVIGGGGIFAAIHYPLFVKEFAQALTLPIAVLSVGAAYRARNYGPLLEKAVFVSGRDATSIKCLSSVLQLSKSPAVRPEDVAFVRDTVLSDRMLTDTDGSCWMQSQGERGQPLCFILPASNFDYYDEVHRQLVAEVVRPGDVFVNVFPKHRKEIEAHNYPGEIREVLDPTAFIREMCSCKAIISGRLHGAILGLHMGVPTFGFFRYPNGDKLPDLMIDTMALSDQFFAVDDDLTREVVDRRVDAVRRLYAEGDRRAAIHTRLSEFFDDFEEHAKHVLFDVIGVPKQ